MTNVLLPAIWLIVLIVGLPQLSETVYTPSLPDIAHALQAPESMVEYTLTIYLFGFAIGTLFWGKVSDRYGRKPCVILGLLIFIIGCVGCYCGTTIEMLLISRLIQAFGGSIGSVLGQAICRDAFHGPALGKAYSSVGSALALFPALGPIIGGIIAEHFKWYNIFLFLMCFAAILTILVSIKLPETHHHHSRTKVSIMKLALKLVQDKHVIGFGLIVAGCNGILFSYFAEGSFYLINILGLSPSKYGLSFTAIGTATMLGGMLSKKLHKHYSAEVIMSYGLTIIGISATVFGIVMLINHRILPLSNNLIIMCTIICQMSISFGICMAISNALALSLVNYKHAIGTASSIFGFLYYCLISLFTLGMGALHNGTLLPMPLYFMVISYMMILVKNVMLEDKCVS